jgi:prepilin-type N-terminal cleavage/methylation domain-containing protein
MDVDIKWQLDSPDCKFTRRHQRSGLTLIELLCVIAIIAIMAALYLGVIAKAFHHILKVLGN